MSYWYPQHFTVLEPASVRAQRILRYAAAPCSR